MSHSRTLITPRLLMPGVTSILVTTSLAVTGMLPAHASDKNGQDNTPAQCRAAHDAVAEGRPLPEIRLFRKGHGALKNSTLTIFDDGSRYTDEIRAAADSWTRASHGAVQVNVVDHPTADSVRVYDVDRNTHWVAWTRRDPWRILLNSAFLNSMSPRNRQSTIAHEFGHAMGLKHGCPGDVMHAFADPGQAVEPTATDIQALLQSNTPGTATPAIPYGEPEDTPDILGS